MSKPGRVRALLAAALLLVAATALAQSPASTQRCEPPEPTASAEAPDDATAQLERGNALVARGEHAAALTAYEESRRLARESGDEPLAALATANAARATLRGRRSKRAGSRMSRPGSRRRSPQATALPTRAPGRSC